MNAQIVRLYAVILLLFTGLVVFTSRWAVLEADELESNPENRRLLIQEQQIERGTITSSDGVLIAESNPAGGEENPNQRVFVRELSARARSSATPWASRSSKSNAAASSCPRTTFSPATRTSSRP